VSDLTPEFSLLVGGIGIMNIMLANGVFPAPGRRARSNRRTAQRWLMNNPEGADATLADARSSPPLLDINILERKMNVLNDVSPILVPIVALLVPIVALVSWAVVKIARLNLLNETVRQMSKNGQPIPPELLDKITGRK
jgi:hypothetical protein